MNTAAIPRAIAHYGGWVPLEMLAQLPEACLEKINDTWWCAGQHGPTPEAAIALAYSAWMEHRYCQVCGLPVSADQRPIRYSAQILINEETHDWELGLAYEHRSCGWRALGRDVWSLIRSLCRVRR